ncbi:MAG: DUF2470 domain-containing protein [Alphaproteobacteria bacterium]|nr:DUF2470 domain-containing protein [Alphaproteobacteria bacterium]
MAKPIPTDAEQAPGDIVRRLTRAADRASLATGMAGGGWPYASLVLLACDHSGRPLLLLSDLADHTKNLKADHRVSLLVDGTAGLEEPLTGPRATIQGRIAPAGDDPLLMLRFLARHPSAALYAGFPDFTLYRVMPERAHLVAGFGRIHWMPADEFLFDLQGHEALAGREADIVAHMNADHADAIDLYASQLLGLSGKGWQLTGCDPEGCDLRLRGQVARLDFDKPVADAEAARVALVRLAKRARRDVRTQPETESPN